MLKKGFVIFGPQGNSCFMTKSFLIFTLLISLTCAKVNHVANYEVKYYELKDSIDLPVAKADEIDSLIAPFKKTLDFKMKEVIGQSAKRLNMAFPESTLGNFIADVLFRKAEEHYDGVVDFAFINYWSIGIAEIQKGVINKGQIYELMPFENHLVIIKVDQDVMYKLFENMAKKGGWPVSKQVKFKITDGKPTDITINGQPLKKDYIYHVAVSDYLANGGDGCSFFKGEDRDIVDVLIREMIMQGIIDLANNGEPVNAELDGRIYLKE